MAFWKKSEDPWDWDPSKKRPAPQPAEPQEPRENPLDTLKQWNEDRKTKAKEKEEAKRLPPEKCPWCGKEMEQGFLTGGRDGVHWYAGIYKFEPFRGLTGDAVDVLDESSWGHYKTTWLCRECGKMVFDIPASERVYDYPGPQEDEAAETTQEEGTSEE